jgi:hypothetical protein
MTATKENIMEEQKNEDQQTDLVEMDYEAVGLPSRKAFNALWHFADQMKGTIFIPDKLRGNAANVFGVMMLAKDLDMAPLQAIQSCYVGPGGQLGMEGDMLLAIMRKKGIKINIKQRDAEACVIEGTRPDGDSAEGIFTIEEARAAGLTKKAGPWQHYPRRMLFWRAVSDLYSQIGTDLLGPMLYSKDEIHEIENDSRQDYEDTLRVGRMESQLKIGKTEPNTEQQTTIEATVIDEKSEVPPAEAEASSEVEQNPQLGTYESVVQEDPPPLHADDQVPPETDDTPAAQENPAPPPIEEDTSETEDAVTTAKQMYGNAIKALVSGGSSDKTAKPKLHNFVRGYLGLETKAQLPSDYIDWIPALEAAITIIDKNNGKLDNPKRAGSQASLASKTDIVNSVFTEWGWGPESIQIIREICDEWDNTPDDLVTWLTGLGINEYNDDDALAFLSTALVTREAYMLAELVTNSGRGAKQIMGEIHKGISEPSSAPSKETIDKALALAAEILNGDQPKQTSLL